MTEAQEQEVKMTQEECENRKWPHNNRTRYDVGFLCRDCNAFFDKDSLTYRRYELPFNYWMIINNIGVEFHRSNEPIPSEIKGLKDKLDNAEKLSEDELEELLFRAKTFFTKYGKNKNSSSIMLKQNKEKEISQRGRLE
jgi:hypothetical protein